MARTQKQSIPIEAGSSRERLANTLPRLEPYRILLFLCILLFVCVFTYLAFDLHMGMRTHKADLGQIAQSIWNSSRGRFVEMTDNGFIATRMTDHVEPILMLISPILWLWQDVRALLLLQVLFIAVGAWPLYELALLCFAKLLTPEEAKQIWQIEPLQNLARPMALALAIAYLLTPQLQAALLTEFHAAPLAVPLILWSLWAVESRRWGHFTIATLLVASVKEEIALLAAGLAVWAIYRLWIDNLRFTIFGGRTGQETAPAQPRTLSALRPIIISTTILILSLTWFYTATFVIVPAHATQVYDVEASVYLGRYGALGNSSVDIVSSFFTQPQLVWQIATEPARISYIWGLLAVFGFLSLLAPELLLIALPLILANLLSAYPAQYYGEFHYSAPLVPFFAAAAAYGMGRTWLWLGRRANRSSSGFQHMPASSAATMAVISMARNSRTALRPLLATTLALWVLLWAGNTYSQAGLGPAGGRYDPVPHNARKSAHQSLLARFVEQIPADAAVTATAAVHPHIALRRFVYQFPIGLPELGEEGSADWALLDVTTNTDLAPGDLKNKVDTLLAGEWGVVGGADGLLFMRRNAPEKAIPDAFFSFARAPEAVSTSQTQKETGAPLVLADVAIDDWPRWRQTKVISYWLVGPSFDPAIDQPQLELRTVNGEQLYNFADSTPPALLWYPPERWQPGEIIEITTLPLYLPKIWGVVVPQNLVPTEEHQTIRADSQLTVAGAFVRQAAEVWQLAGDGTGLLQTGQWRTTSSLIPPISHSVNARFDIGAIIGSDDVLELNATILDEIVWPDKAINAQLLWSNAPWPQSQASAEPLEPLTVFVHLRRNGENVAQADGLPRLFVPLPLQLSDQEEPSIDWRQLRVPPPENFVEDGGTAAIEGNGTASSERVDFSGKWTVVVGLYDPTSGHRVDLLDDNGQPIGNELMIGTLMPGKAPVPDQACALNALACASQPE